MEKLLNSDAERLVIVGTGWAGFTLSQELNDRRYKVTVVSPERTCALTPLLASAACGLFDFRMAEEPVRRQHRSTQHVKANVENVDFKTRQVSCRSSITGTEDITFNLPYDKLILAPGCKPNTFGTPGVEENGLFMRNVKDAVALRTRILDLFEIASLPVKTVQEQKELLHIAIVGGGPTGVELAAELDDLANKHLYAVYPNLTGLMSLTIHDVAPQILSPFENKLSEYAIKSFERRHINIAMNSHIEKAEPGAIFTKEDGRIPCGALIWATGNKQGPLVDALDVAKPEKGMPRLLTDSYLRVLQSGDKSHFDNVYALGDAADIDGVSLPTTAEVAVQKARYLCKALDSEPEARKPFAYQQKNMTAYLGGHDGIVEGGKQDWTGTSAWLAWRRGSLEWTKSWRRRAMIMMYWLMNYLDGREIARK